MPSFSDFANAVSRYSEVIHLQPQEAAAYLGRERHLAIEDYDSAIADLQQARQLQRGTHAGQDELAQAYLLRANALHGC